jgi:2-amino-4-hydroxy-6-hydroxymethyldihydropteridine diphosphokinase
MSLIIATGSNLGNREENLIKALNELKKIFIFKAASQIYSSKAQDYLEQPDFLNQVLEFSLPDQTPAETMQQLLEIELKMGRVRERKYGPRVIDLDLIFWSFQKIDTEFLIVPHPKWNERSFVVRPLLELPFGQEVKKIFTISDHFSDEAFVYQKA